MKSNQKQNTESESVKCDIDRRSEEVTDIIERMPTGWMRIVVTIIMIIVIVMVSLGFIIKYPDTVVGQISITGEKAPIRLISSASGRLQLLVNNNNKVEKGACLGYLETGAVYEDVLKLDTICSIILKEDTQLLLPGNLELGALSAYYNDFVLAYNQFNQLRRTKVYDNIRQKLHNQRRSDLRVSENLEKEISLSDQVIANISEQYKSDSLLYRTGALSEEDMAKQYNVVLSSRLSNIELKSTGLIKQAEINSIDIELAKIDVDVKEELNSAYNSMASKFNVLINQIHQWKEHYLFIAPISGILQYQEFWRNNMYVNTSSEIFSISPDRNHMIGELLIPALGAGKVKVGQDVNIKLADYPYDEYGYIRGKVEMISPLARNINNQDGSNKAYLVKVSFPDGLTTNFGKQLPLNYESGGSGEIITEKRRLIQRLFDNLKAKETK